MDPSKEKLYEVLRTIVGELASVFPGPYMHIGGDEVSGVIHWWRADHPEALGSGLPTIVSPWDTFYLDYMVFPRLIALAEKAWSSTLDYSDFLRRLEGEYRYLDSIGVYYYDFRDFDRHPEPRR